MFMNQEDLNVVEETKRATEAAWKERLLDAIAIAYSGATVSCNRLVTESLKDGATSGPMVAIASTMLFMQSASETAMAVAKHMGLTTQECHPDALRPRIARLKQEGKISA